MECSALHDGQTITPSPGLSRLRLHHSRAQRPLAGARRASSFRATRAAIAARPRNTGAGTAGPPATPTTNPPSPTLPVDAVVVAVPPRFHLPLTLQALEAGKHVLVEKPAFLTPGRLRDGPCRAGARRPHRPGRRERPLQAAGGDAAAPPGRRCDWRDGVCAVRDGGPSAEERGRLAQRRIDGRRRRILRGRHSLAAHRRQPRSERSPPFRATGRSVSRSGPDGARRA